MYPIFVYTRMVLSRVVSNTACYDQCLGLLWYDFGFSAGFSSSLVSLFYTRAQR